MRSTTIVQSGLVALASVASLAQGAHLQGVLQSHEKLLRHAASSLGFSSEDVDNIPNDIRAVWSEMQAKFPEETSNWEFLSKPQSEVRTRSDWDFHVKSNNVENYQLRVRKINEPSSLGIDDVKQYSGYLDVEEEDKHFFYWFFESRNDPKKDPIVLWLNGGPGCSSLTGLFFELGPSSLGPQLKPIRNPYSWNSNASVIFLDQPVNVGYSYSSSGVTNTVAAAADVYAFLQLFFEQFPEYQSGQDFHIAGESYAGHYIPAFASEILSHPANTRSFNLTSVLIGNGLTDPLTQYKYYEPMACGNGGAPPVLQEDQCREMNRTLPRCLGLIKSCYAMQNVWSCVPATLYCNQGLLGPFQRTGTNVYDVRKQCEGDLCYADMQYMDQYLNQAEVIKAVGAEVSSFQSCNMDINRNFVLNGDWMKPYHRDVTSLLEAGVPVLIYAGDKDFICNWLGNEAWTNTLKWQHTAEFSKEKLHDWIGASGKVAGQVKNYEHFTFLRIYEAGHMVPYDVPESSLIMLNSWLGGDYKLQGQSKKD